MYVKCQLGPAWSRGYSHRDETLGIWDTGITIGGCDKLTRCDALNWRVFVGGPFLAEVGQGRIGITCIDHKDPF